MCVYLQCSRGHTAGNDSRPDACAVIGRVCHRRTTARSEVSGKYSGKRVWEFEHMFCFYYCRKCTSCFNAVCRWVCQSDTMQSFSAYCSNFIRALPDSIYCSCVVYYHHILLGREKGSLPNATESRGKRRGIGCVSVNKNLVICYYEIAQSAFKKPYGIKTTHSNDFSSEMYHQVYSFCFNTVSVFCKVSYYALTR